MTIKTVYILSLLFFFSLHFCVELYSQNDIEWSKVYGGQSGEEAWKLDFFNDEIAIVGSSRSNDFGIDNDTQTKAFFLLLDNNGDLISLNTYAEAETNYLLDILKLSDGMYLAAGWIEEEPGSQNYDYWVIKLDSDGEKMWSKKYGGSSNDLLINIFPLENNEFMLVGSSCSDDGDVSNSEDGELWLVRIDIDGNIIWDKSFGNEFNPFLDSATLLSDGSILLGAGLFESGQSWDINLIKISSSGEELWRNELGGSSTELVNDVKEAANGDILVTGSSESTDSQLPNGSFIVRYDSMGNLKWISEIEGVMFSSRINPRSDGKIDVFGSIGEVWNQTDVEHLIFSEDGDIIEKKSYGGSLRDVVRSVKAISEGFLVTGFSNSSDGDVQSENSNASIWVFKLSDSTLSNPDINLDNIQIHPNPTHEYIYVKNTNANVNSIELYNMSGQLLQSYFKENCNQINVSQLIDGQYVLRIKNGDSTVVKLFSKVTKN